MSEIKLLDSERTRCENWTRVMGYHRPVSCFNEGKKQEYADRKLFTEKAAARHEWLEEIEKIERALERIG